MILGAPLGDVVQEQRDVDQIPVLRENGAHQIVGERVFGVLSPFDFGQDADAAQQMLIHRVVMIHIELHHRHDAPEIGDEAAEHADLVHAAQHDLGVVLRGQDFVEHVVGLRVGAQMLVDQPQRARRRPHRVRVKSETVPLREAENANEVFRVAPKYVGVGDIDAVVVDDEIVALAQYARRPLAQARDEAIEHRHVLLVPALQAGAQNGGEIADILRHEEVVLHEAFDVAQAGMRRVTEPLRHLALNVEGEPLLRPAGGEMHMAADRPEEIFAALKQAIFLFVEHAASDQLPRLTHAVDVFGDPEQRVQIAQAAFAVLDVRLDQIARLADPTQALFALGELGGDEFGAGTLGDLLVEAGDELVEQLLLAEQEARFENGGADGHVRPRLADAFVDRAGGVPDLQPHVPQAIENRFGDRFAPRGLLVGKQEQEIDVRSGRQQAAAIPAGRDNRHVLALGRILGGVEMGGGELVEDADDLVLHLREALGAGAALAVLEQKLLGLGASLGKRRLQALRHRQAQLALATAIVAGDAAEVGLHGLDVEQFGGGAFGLFEHGIHTT
jgi:hypothetical protein